MLPMLTKDVRKALEGERQFCKAQRDQLDAKIKALDLVLSPDDQLGFFEREIPPLAVTERHAGDHGNGPVSAMGLREAMRFVLAQYPSGLSGKELAEKVEQFGWKTDGKTPVYSRVAGEASRMKRKGKLAKRDRRYILTTD